MAFLGPELGHDYYLDGDWHHVAVVMGTDFNKMYIDGAQVSGRYPWTVGGSPASGGCMWPSSISRVEIGRDYLQSGFFDGAIDEVRVYGRALSATEVNQLHSQVFDNECEQDVLEFSGLTWDVSCRNGNPGNGCFSSSTDSVWIENPRTSNERLHLKVRQLDDGRWCQAEVTARIPANYGRHRFDLTSGPWEIDENVVIGMFLYRDFPAQGGECIENGCQFDVNQGYCLCEIDIEITGSFDSARCTNVLPPPSGINLFYTVQPNRDLFLDCRWFPLTGELNSVVSTHTFDWRENQVMFQSWEGHCDSPPCVGAGPWQTSPWIYDEQNTFDNTSKPALILNLWAVPPIISEYEVVFDRFYSDWIYRDDFESGDTTAWYGGAP